MIKLKDIKRTRNEENGYHRVKASIIVDGIDINKVAMVESRGIISDESLLNQVEKQLKNTDYGKA